MKLRERVEFLMEYFGEVDLAKNGNEFDIEPTEKGDFLPSPLCDVDILLEKLVKEGVIDPAKPILDAGSGDGRFVAMANAYGFPSYGIEYNWSLVGESEHHLEALRQQGALNGTPARIAQGDFLRNAAYRRLGVNFTDFSTIYNFVNNEEGLARRIIRESPPGTTFILYGGSKRDGLIQGLGLRESIQLIDPRDKGSNAIMCFVYVKG